MRPIAFAVVIALLAGAPAVAQNAAQIAQAKRGGNCPGCNLFQADLGGTQLKNKNFAGARLRQADLSASVMNGTNFASADLRDLDAYGAVFTGATFSGADLTNASFVGTYLEGANFARAKLNGANFSGAEMDRARGLSQGQLNTACGDASTKLPRGMTIPACK